jgi:SHS2 domain-containing protein
MQRGDSATRRGEFVEIDHTADLGLDLRGATPAAVLEAALRGLAHVLFGGDPPRLEPREERRIVLAADSWAELLKAWLEGLYRLLEDERFLPSDVRFERVEPTGLEAVVIGACPPREAIAEASELKAVTYHQLSFAREGEHWRARVIFDV